MHFDTFYAGDGGPMVATSAQGSVRLGGSRNRWAEFFKPFGLGSAATMQVSLVQGNAPLVHEEAARRWENKTA